VFAVLRRAATGCKWRAESMAKYTGGGAGPELIVMVKLVSCEWRPQRDGPRFGHDSRFSRGSVSSGRLFTNWARANVVLDNSDLPEETT